MNKVYKTITKRLTYLDAELFTGSVKEIIEELEKLNKTYPGYDDFFIEADYNPDAYVEYDLFGIRKETDEERDKRLAKAKKARLSQKKARLSQKKRREKESKEKEAKELKTYEKLKAKFGKGK